MYIRTAKDLGLLLRERRRELGWSQAELATRIGVARQWVVGVERGKPRAEIGLVLNAVSALQLVVEIDPRAPGAPASEITQGTPARANTSIDLQSILDRARATPINRSPEKTTGATTTATTAARKRQA